MNYKNLSPVLAIAIALQSATPAFAACEGKYRNLETPRAVPVKIANEGSYSTSVARNVVTGALIAVGTVVAFSSYSNQNNKGTLVGVGITSAGIIHHAATESDV